MENKNAPQRILSIDLLKGLVMVIMALDHTRDYFHYSAFYFDPTDPTKSTLPIFFTRFITHFCAPAFSFLAGLSACLVGRRKSKSELSSFLVKRGLWLVFIELTIVNFAWYFDLSFRNPSLIVIWSLGISMIVLAALIHLPKKIILVFSILVIFGHNLLDTTHFTGNVLWAILHEYAIFNISETHHLNVYYPIIPWIAVMSLGYYFGSFYDKSYDILKRKKVFNRIGISALLLFVFIRFINRYGDPIPWKDYGTISKDLISFLNPSKYPPSLLYLLMTLSGTILFLANSEKLKGKVVDFFSTFGRVPFFYYIIHIYVIHLFALLFAQLTGFGWKIMILPTWVSEVTALKGYGFPLSVVYAVWIGIILLLYPICKKFDNYKQSHKEKWWLSYL
ncbi:DUF1624 domain-containing protein [Flavobacterium cellulosilyticum]|uniref:DUF1624 domain-containing protein n=1 Tax=Flavobacterium cellulosilyticum TaxID=2541731 RepID=A0A4R5CKQ2_9FLAO|nr:heparan-alpha-glucosaminide N-acetyltransferase domain-containing protein [Flavobacterium cellulosilyticum]TDD98032.1 DUF1624 domain-containing protein [Flavobacterium cellulosilyticum]